MMRSRRDRIHIALLAAGLTVSLLAGSSGFVQAGGNTQFRNPANLSEVFDKTWDDRMLPIAWVMSEDGLPGSGIDNPTLTTELTAAFDTWEALPTSRLDFEFGGELPIHSAGLEGPLGPGVDGRNLVTFTDPDLLFPPGVLAVAITFSFAGDTVITSANSDLDGDSLPDIPEGTYSAGTIFDGDIAFNSSESWAISGANGTIDIRAVALHEVGHFFGLCHSMIRDAVMWPFLSSDISAARTPKLDDVAYASFFYPNEPAYSSMLGAIRGHVVNGFSSGPVLGAHVYSVDPSTGDGVVGAYTGDDGSYVIPGLAGGGYLVAIEPLDGDPVGLDPSRINEVVQFTFDTNFPEEFYDANESNVEADPLAGQLVTVTAGADTTAIDLVTNSVQVPGVNVVLESGYNLFAYPVKVPGGLNAFDLLQALGDDTEVNAIDRRNPDSGSFERASWVDGSPAGVNFPIRRGEGYVVYIAAQKVVNFSGDTDCPAVELKRGLNLIGVPCPPAGYTAYELLQDVGARFEVQRIQSFDSEAGTFMTTEYDPGDQPIGDDFPVSNGEGYVVTMLADKSGLQIPPPGSNFPPVLTGISPGRGVAGTIVVILGEGFDSDVSKNVVSFNGVGAGVIFATSTSLTLTVPATATSGPVQVTVNGQQSNTIDFEVVSASVMENPGGDTSIESGQTATGTLGVEGEQDRYTFTALAGSLVTVTAEAVTPGVPDLALLIEDPLGVVIATDDNGGVGSDPRVNNFELQSTGIHTIVVTSLPGTGTGDYNVSLTVTTRATAPQVSILGGNFQTSVAGSTLPVPLTVLATGATGAPVAGVPVTFVSSDASFGSSSINPTNSGTVVIDTNASGIASVQTSLPSAEGQYSITVTAANASPVSFTVAATTTAVTSVAMNGDLQSGTVGQPLASPFEVVLRDSNNNPVSGALVAFVVAAGGGSISGTSCTGSTTAVCQTTGAPGSASTTLTLGTKTSDSHLVAAFVPGMLQPLLFEATPEAGSPNSVRSNKSNFNRLTLGTAALSAMRIEVFDQYDNPVPDVTVSYSAPGGLLVSPGLGPGGIFFTDFQTNENGLHVAMLTAQSSGTPTINEFGERVDPVLGVTATVAGGHSEPYSVDVDMGPNMVTASAQNDAALIGQPLGSPVAKLVLRWERNDTYEDLNGDDEDDDNGDFRNDDFSSMSPKGVENVTIDLEVVREDGRDEADEGLTPLTIDATTMVTDVNGIGTVNVTTMGDVGGVKKVIGRIDEIFVEWKFADGTTMDTQTFTDENRFGESTNLIAIPVKITVDIQDPGSGIHFPSILATLNTHPAFFNGASPPTVFPDFADRLELVIGGTPVDTLVDFDPATAVFGDVRIVYYPSAPKLIPSNTVTVQAVQDKVGNAQSAPTPQIFSYP